MQATHTGDVNALQHQALRESELLPKSTYEAGDAEKLIIFIPPCWTWPGLLARLFFFTAGSGRKMLDGRPVTVMIRVPRPARIAQHRPMS